MAFQSVPSVAETRLVYSQLGNTRPIVSVFSWLKVGGWTQASVDALATATATAWDDFLRAELHTSLELTSIQVRDLEDEFGPATATFPALAGLEAVAPASINNNVVVTFLPGGGGPPRRGRYFHPYVEELSVDPAGRISAAFASQIRVATAGFAGSVEAAAAWAGLPPAPSHAIVSRYTRKVPPPGSVLRPVGLSATVLTYIGRTRVGSQRDRRTVT